MNTKIRIGNDIDIHWSLFDSEESPYIIEGKNVTIELNIGTKKIKIKDVELSGNTAHFVFYGKDQKYIGTYVLKFIENDGLENMVTFDTNNAFTLVDHSWQAIDEGETPETIQLEFVSVTSGLLERIGPKGDKGDTGPKGDDGEPGGVVLKCYFREMTPEEYEYFGNDYEVLLYDHGDITSIRQLTELVSKGIMPIVDAYFPTDDGYEHTMFLRYGGSINATLNEEDIVHSFVLDYATPFVYAAVFFEDNENLIGMLGTNDVSINETIKQAEILTEDEFNEIFN